MQDPTKTGDRLTYTIETTSLPCQLAKVSVLPVQSDFRKAGKDPEGGKEHIEEFKRESVPSCFELDLTYFDITPVGQV